MINSCRNCSSIGVSEKVVELIVSGEKLRWLQMSLIYTTRWNWVRKLSSQRDCVVGDSLINYVLEYKGNSNSANCCILSSSCCDTFSIFVRTALDKFRRRMTWCLDHFTYPSTNAAGSYSELVMLDDSGSLLSLYLCSSRRRKESITLFL